MTSNIEELIRARLNFIMKYNAQCCLVGYYTGQNQRSQFHPIKLTELVSFDNAIVVGTSWEDYIPITTFPLEAKNAKGGVVAYMPVPEELVEYVNKQKGDYANV